MSRPFKNEVVGGDGKRKYRITEVGGGLVNIEREYVPEIVGDEFGAEAVNKLLVINDNGVPEPQIAKHFDHILIPESGWGNLAPYRQTVQVEGMIKNGYPFPFSNDKGEAKEEFYKITDGETADGSVTFIADTDRPTKDLDVRIEVFF